MEAQKKKYYGNCETHKDKNGRGKLLDFSLKCLDCRRNEAKKQKRASHKNKSYGNYGSCKMHKDKNGQEKLLDITLKCIDCRRNEAKKRKRASKKVKD